MSDTIAFNPGRGVEAMKAATDFTGGDFRKIHHFTMFVPKPGDKVVVRFITPIDKMPVVKFHNFVPTDMRKAPAGSTNWPKTMSAVCRRDPAFTGFSDCYICDNKIENQQGKVIKATPKMTAIACLRMEYKNDDGSTGWTDVPREVKIKEGDEVKEVVERSLIMVSMAPSNFWDNIMGYGQRYGTLSDRDYEIERQGEGISTKYIPFPMDKDPELYPGSAKWAYEQAAETQGLNVDQFIVNQASNEYYARFFDPRFTVNDKGIVVPVSGASGSPAADAAQESNAEKIRRLQEEMRQGQVRAEAATADAFGGSAPTGDPWANGTPGF